MRLSTSICVLILSHICLVEGMSFNFGSLLRSRNQPLTASPSRVDEFPTHEFRENEQSEEDTSSYSSESYSEFRSDSDSYLFNSSSEEDSTDMLIWNSSSDGNDTSDLKSSSNVTSNSTQESSSGSSHYPESHTSNEMHSSSESSDSDKVIWQKVSTPAADQSTTFGRISAANFTTEEPEKVAVVTGENTTQFGPKTVFQKSIEWVEDEYTLSILLPIAAGIIFAVTIICTIAMCRCMTRCCRRRRFRKKCLPDSVKSLSASDRARLLGDTSDEEF